MSADQQILPAKLAALQKKALKLGAVISAVAVVFALLFSRDTFFQSYLIGFLYALGFGLGSLVLLCIHHLAGGRWGHGIRRILEAGTRTMPFLFLLFLPILFFGKDALYGQWMGVYEEVAAEAAHQPVDYERLNELDPHHLVRQKTAYLNPTGYDVRSVVYFLIWAALGGLLVGWSRKQDSDPSQGLAMRSKMKALAGPAILIYLLALTFASVDWAMSINPEWFSSIYGVMFAIGHGLTIFAFSIIFVCWLKQFSPHKEFFGAKQLHDLGKLQFAFVILWAYIEVSQFIIIWSANLGEETPWLLDRATPLFKPLTWFLVLGQFAVPFFILLNQRLKQRFDLLPKICAWILFIRIIDLYWMVAPSIHTPHFAEEMPTFLQVFSLSDLLAPIGFALLWFGVFLHFFRQLPVLPLNDPTFSEGFDPKEVH